MTLPADFDARSLLFIPADADRFIAKGRFERRMQSIPVKLVIHPQPGLYGAAAAFAKDHR